MIHKIVKYVVLLVLFIFIYGVLCPGLISAKDTDKVITGFIILFGYIPLFIFFVKEDIINIYYYFKEKL